MTAAIPLLGRMPEETQTRMLRLAAQGWTDEAIAHRLECSVRTVRRHLSIYMHQVGAVSRFQAGVLAAQRGDVNS